MDWIQFTVFFLGNSVLGFTLWLWNRTEGAAERREILAKTCADRREIMNLLNAIQAEIKDFHGRLCAIEEKKR